MIREHLITTYIVTQGNCHLGGGGSNNTVLTITEKRDVEGAVLSGGGGMFSPSRTAINCQPWNNGLTVGIGNI